MGYTISKKVVTNYTIKQLVVTFLTDVKQYLEVRNKLTTKNKMTSCFNCGYKFQETDPSIGLATTDKGNIILCNDCSTHIANLNDPEIQVIQQMG